MAWLLFMDESGHDHKQMPYEVRGGFALHDEQLWPFVRDVMVGDGVTVGAGSVVVKNVEPDCVVAGVPAQIIRRGAPKHTLTKTERSE